MIIIIILILIVIILIGFIIFNCKYNILGNGPLTSESIINLINKNNKLIQDLISTNNNQIQKYLSGSSFKYLPIGSVVCFAGSMIPSDYLECDGRQLNKNKFPELFNVIGYIYTNCKYYDCDVFNVPDLRGLFVRGIDTGKGYDPDRRNLGSFQNDAIKKHRHYNLFGNIQRDSISNDLSQGKKEFYYDELSRNLIPFASFYTQNEYSYANMGIQRDANSALSSFDLINSDINIIGNSFKTNSSSETRPKNISLYYIIKYI